LDDDLAPEEIVSEYKKYKIQWQEEEKMFEKSRMERQFAESRKENPMMKFHDWLLNQGVKEDLTEDEAMEKITGDYAAYVKEYKQMYFLQDNTTSQDNQTNVTEATTEVVNATVSETENSTSSVEEPKVDVIEEKSSDSSNISSSSLLDSRTNISSNSSSSSILESKNDTDKQKSSSSTDFDAMMKSIMGNTSTSANSSSITSSLSSASSLSSNSSELASSIVDDPACKDEDPGCPDWAADNQCSANPDFMMVSCRKSCNKCGGDASATASDSTSLANSLLSNAMSSSATTSDTSSSSSVSVDCKDDDPGCAGWAADNQCTANPDFMLMTCKKSCNSCDQKDSTSDSTAQAAGLVHLIDQGSDLFDYYKKGKSEQQGQQGQQGQETKVAEQQADSKTETKKPRRDVEIGWFEKLLSKFQFE
jgi:hypothetical protein